MSSDDDSKSHDNIDSISNDHLNDHSEEDGADAGIVPAVSVNQEESGKDDLNNGITIA